ncbi:MAG: hypothetical protein ABSE99_15600 [Terracidiphilus sp.]|jgi:hypothetical protein
MQQPAEPGFSPSFAGLLAALAAPAQNPVVPSDRSSSLGWKSSLPGDGSSLLGLKGDPDWNTDDPADDGSTLSYEDALRAHARYRSAGPPAGDLPDAQPFTFEPAYPRPAFPADASSRTQAAPLSSANDDKSGTARALPPDPELKCASVTIRLSRAESAQLRRRAAEAGLTVSAYLRSCTFEVESLRAQVKEALAQMRSAAAAGKPTPKRSRSGWLRRLFGFRKVLTYSRGRSASTR